MVAAARQCGCSIRSTAHAGTPYLFVSPAGNQPGDGGVGMGTPRMATGKAKRDLCIWRLCRKRSSRCAALVAQGKTVRPEPPLAGTTADATKPVHGDARAVYGA